MLAAIVHEAVLRRLRDLDQDNTKGGFFAQPDRVVLAALFLNYRNGRGLRLTAFGLTLLKPLAFHYEVQLETARATDIAQLESRLTMPYFVNADRIVVFEEEAAVLLRLTKGDLKTFVQITDASPTSD